MWQKEEQEEEEEVSAFINHHRNKILSSSSYRYYQTLFSPWCYYCRPYQVVNKHHSGFKQRMTKNNMQHHRCHRCHRCRPSFLYSYCSTYYIDLLCEWRWLNFGSWLWKRKTLCCHTIYRNNQFASRYCYSTTT